MNKIFRVVWNRFTCSWVAVAEITKTRGKAASGTIGQAHSNQHRFKPTLLVSALSLLFTHAAFAAPASTTLPTGGQVVAGTAGITQSAGVMNINQTTNRAAIDWATFNVGSAAQVRFNQPDASSVTLNRVQDSNPSQIFGKISAPGQVFLSNPNGVYFSPSGSVDVGGLVATTHHIGVDDFMAGKTTFERNGATGSVINEGQLKASLGGYIALLAPDVSNQGVVIAEAGTAILAAGEAITLNFANNGSLTGITSTKSQIDALVENKHAVLAPGGLIILSAQAANSLAGGLVNNSGTLEASSLTEKGGRIWLEGDTVTLGADSSTRATGALGGGEVLVGGGWQGHGVIANARNTSVESGAAIDVSATHQGDGGTAVVWSDETTTYRGAISAQGGVNGGNGGQVEVSGKQQLDFSGQVDTSAPQGTHGNLLLDPENIVIATTAPAGAGAETTSSTVLSDKTANPGSISWIAPSTLVNLLKSNAVLVAASNDITVSDAIDASANTVSKTLQLEADHDILINADIKTYGLFSATAKGDFTMAANTSIDTSASTNSDITISSGDGTTPSTATISSLKSRNITIKADTMALIGGADSIISAGASVALLPKTTTRAVEVGDAPVGHSQTNTLVINNAALSTINTFALVLGEAGDNKADMKGGVTVFGALPTAGYSRLTISNSGTGGSITLHSTARLGTDTTGFDRLLTLQAGNLLNPGSITIEDGAIINVGTQNLTMEADSIALGSIADSIMGTADLVLTPTTMRPMIINGTESSSSLVIDSTELSTLKDGFRKITFGNTGLKANMSIVGDWTFKDSVTFALNGQDGHVTLDGNMSNGSVTGSSTEVYFQAASFTQASNATMDVGTGTLAISTNTISLNGVANSIKGTKTLQIQPLTPARMFVIAGTGNGASTELHLNNSELATFEDGFSSITYGNMYAIDLKVDGPLTIKDPTTFWAQAQFAPAARANAGMIALGAAADITVDSLVGSVPSILFYVNGTFTQSSTAKLSAGAGAMTIQANTIDLGGAANSISGTGALDLYPYSSDRPILLGAAGLATDFALTTTELATLADGFSLITVGGTYSKVGISVKSALTFQDPLKLKQASGGSYTIDAALSVDGGLWLDNKSTAINASITASGDTFFYGPVTIGAADVIISAGTGVLTFKNGVDYGTRGLTVTSDNIAIEYNWTGTGGDVSLQTYTADRSIGLGTTVDYALSTTEFTRIFYGTPNSVTIGSNDSGPMLVNGTLGFDNPLTLKTGSTIAIESTAKLNGTGAAGASPLTLSAGTGVTLSGTIDTGTSTLAVQSSTGDITIGGSLKTTSTSANAISINAGVNSAAGTAEGGNIIISGTPSITVGDGGKVKLYSGASYNVALRDWMAGLSSAVIYSADELTSMTAEQTTAINAATYIAIYRQEKVGTPVYLRLTGGSSVYGDSITLNYGIFDASTGGTLVTGTSPTGTVSWSGTAPTSSSNVGTYTLTYGSGITLGNSDYSLVAGASADWIITAKTVSLSASKVYDGLTSLSGSVTITTGVGSETLTYTGATASNAHVGMAGKYISAITLADATDSSGGLASNYMLPTLDATNAPVTITAKALTVTAPTISGNNKTYDGLLVASGSSLSAGGVTGFIGSDTGSLNTSGITLAYNSAHVADATTIAASGSTTLAFIGLGKGTGDGSSAGNEVAGASTDYTYTAPTIADLTGTISAKALTVSAPTISGNNKTYDGLLAASGSSLSAGSVTGFVGSDSGSWNTSGITLAYNSVHVNNATTIAASGAVTMAFTGLGKGSANGSSAGNEVAGTSTDYDYTVPTIANLTGNISAKVVSLTASKIYDGSSDLSAAVSIATGVGSETLTYTNATASNAHVATLNKYINAITLADASDSSGGLASNYALPTLDVDHAPVTITPAMLTATLNNSAYSQVYDGDITADLTPTYSFNGLVQGDTGATLTHTQAVYDDKDVADATTITISGLSIVTITGSKGSASTDYVLDTTSKAVAATITKANATVTANSANTTYDGESHSVSGFTVSGLANGETSAVLTGVATSGGSGTNAGEYALTVSGQDSNYELTLVDGKLTIDKRAITVTADDQTKTNGAPDPELTYRVTAGTLVDGEALTGDISRAPGEIAGTYAIDDFSELLQNGNYDIASVSGTLTIRPTVVPVTEDAPKPLPNRDDDPAARAASQNEGADLLRNVDSKAVVNAETAPTDIADKGGSAGGAHQTGEGGILISVKPRANGGSSDANPNIELVTVSVPKSIAQEGKGLRFDLPDQAKTAVGGGSVSVTQADGSALPGWISFNGTTKSFDAAAVPKNGLPLRVVITSGEKQVVVVISERQQ